MKAPRTRWNPWIALLLVVVLAAPGTQSQSTLNASDPVTVTALAVAETAGGALQGVSAGVEAVALGGGSGRVFVATEPLAQLDMQGSARLAARVAASTLGLDWRDYDYLITFRSPSSVIGGPSAGAVMSLALTTALQHLSDPANPWELDSRVAATGTINPDGTIGPVGGIPEKAQGAYDAGIRLFLYPAGMEVATVRDGFSTRQVNMTDHCNAIGIECRPAASLVQVIELAAGVKVAGDDAPVPGTVDYADVLAPSVEDSVEALEARMERAQQALAAASLRSSEQARVTQSLDMVAERLADARTALLTERYYTAATMAFQGSLWAGEAENLTALLRGDEGVVARALETCGRTAEEAQDYAYALRADDTTGFYAVAAAQVRAYHAGKLFDEATSRASGFGSSQLQSLFSASFCTERAKTVSWWGGLGDLFGRGPRLSNVADLAQDAVSRADELVGYAQAVTGTPFGIEGASGKLAEAHEHLEAKRWPAAASAAIEAQAQASLTVQTASGAAPSSAVMDAARQSASRAIMQARDAGIEPITSVALVELSEDEAELNNGLLDLWIARSMAVLTVQADQDSRRFEPTDRPDLGANYDAGSLRAAMVLGILLGGGAVALIAAAVTISGSKR